MAEPTVSAEGTAKGIKTRGIPSGSAKTGRRPGNPDTRAAIIDAAKAEFAARGFDKASIRGIAKVAGVDPALVHHYFDSKDDLLIVSLEIPLDPRRLLAQLTGPGIDGLGLRIATRFLSIWDNPELRTPLVALVKASMASDAAAELMRDGMVRMVMQPISATIDAEDALLRAQRVVSQLLGVIMARYVLRLQPLASEPAADVVGWLAPTLQRYLDGQGPDEP